MWCRPTQERSNGLVASKTLLNGDGGRHPTKRDDDAKRQADPTQACASGESIMIHSLTRNNQRETTIELERITGNMLEKIILAMLILVGAVLGSAYRGTRPYAFAIWVVAFVATAFWIPEWFSTWGNAPSNRWVSPLIQVAMFAWERHLPSRFHTRSAPSQGRRHRDAVAVYRHAVHGLVPGDGLSLAERSRGRRDPYRRLSGRRCLQRDYLTRQRQRSFVGNDDRLFHAGRRR